MKWLSLALLLFTLLPLQAAEPEGPPAEDLYTGKVVVISVGEKDLINNQSFKFWRRTLERVNAEEAAAVLFELDTPGGLAIQTKEIMVNELRDLSVPSYAFVNDEAISAGALISVATDGIYMAPGSTIGAAALVSGTGMEIDETMRAKMESFFNANVRAVTADKGHPAEIVQMMMFIDEENDREYGPIKVPKNELLTLTAAEAVQEYNGKPILADGIVSSREELIAAVGLGGKVLVEARPTGFEKIAWWISSFSAVLILIGIGGAYFELKAPGFGLGGIVALAAFGTFFFGNFVAGNLAGYELIAVFVIGAVFILLDLFLFPNFILSFIGGLMMIGSLFASMIDRFDFQDFTQRELITSEGSWLDLLARPATNLTIGLIGGLILILLLMRFLHYIPFPGFVLKRAQDSQIAPTTGTRPTPSHLIGATGQAITDLRPAGKMLVEQTSYDVITRGEYIAKGSNVVVVKEEAMRVVVEKSV